MGYTVRDDTELIDYDEVRDLARAAPAQDDHLWRDRVPAADRLRAFREIADEVGAYLMVDAAHFIGLVAGGAIPSPVPYADVVCFTTHKVLRGPARRHDPVPGGTGRRIDKAVFPFTQGGPLMHVVAAKAVALREAAQPAFADYARQVIANARALAEGPGGRRDAAGLRRHRHPPGPDRPAPARRSPARDGRRQRCDLARITLNKNAIPYDPQKPMVASGIRVGTPSVTTQGMGRRRCTEIASLIGRAVRSDPETDGAAARWPTWRTR